MVQKQKKYWKNRNRVTSGFQFAVAPVKMDDILFSVGYKTTFVIVPLDSTLSSLFSFPDLFTE